MKLLNIEIAVSSLEMKEKILLANLLAPVAFVEHMKSPIALLAPFANILEVMPNNTYQT